MVMYPDSAGAFLHQLLFGISDLSSTVCSIPCFNYLSFQIDQFLFFWLTSSCYLEYLYAIQHGYQLWAPNCNIQQRGGRAFTFDIRHPLLTSWLWLSGWPGEVLFFEHPILISPKALESETKQHWVLACLLPLTHPVPHTSRIWSLLGINKWIKNIQGLKLLHFNRGLQH